MPKIISTSKTTIQMSIQKDLEKWYNYEEAFWKTKATDNNLHLGDKNTGYFHSTATYRARKLRIEAIKKTDDTWCNDKQGIIDTFYTHFASMATSSNPSISEHILQLIPKCLSDLDNSKLMAIPSELEIKLIVFDMHPNKSPGPDGFPAIFFQKNWFLIKDEVTKMVQEFFTTKHILKEFNATFITLIPKIETPTTPKDFRPISLCNTIYKIISKLLAGRINHFLDKIISPYQSAFVPGRLIVDNIVIAHEIIHTMRSEMKKQKKKGYMGLKIDMSKSFDRVECDFLIKIMEKLDRLHIPMYRNPH